MADESQSYARMREPISPPSARNDKVSGRSGIGRRNVLLVLATAAAATAIKQGKRHGCKSFELHR